MATMTSRDGHITLELENSEAAQVTLRGSDSNFGVAIIELPNGRRILRIYLQDGGSVYPPDSAPSSISICPPSSCTFRR